MNILDYLDWRGDILFSERGLNEIDNLIFSTLAYTKMEGLISEDDEKKLTIFELYEEYVKAGYDQSMMIINPITLLKKASEADRYKNVIVRNYVNKIDTEMKLQFSAVTFELGKEFYIAYRGTDNTLVGWREDCNLSYLDRTPGQFEAVRYLNEIAGKSDNSLTVGGHSKGGNFAVYAGSFCDEEVKERIIRIYSNDGPGFNDTVANSSEYLSVIPKTEHIITDSSIVGMLLSSKTKKKIIKSSAMGLDQHDPYTWNVKCTEFEKAEGLSTASVFMDNAITIWINSLSDDNKRVFVNTVFDFLENSGAKTLNDIADKKWEVYNSVLKAMTQMNNEKKLELGFTVKKFFDAGRDAIINFNNNDQNKKLLP